MWSLCRCHVKHALNADERASESALKCTVWCVDAYVKHAMNAEEKAEREARLKALQVEGHRERGRERGETQSLAGARRTRRGTRSEREASFLCVCLSLNDVLFAKRSDFVSIPSSLSPLLIRTLS